MTVNRSIFQAIRRHRLGNWIHTAILFLAMAGLLCVVGWMIAGYAGIKLAMLMGTLIFIFSPRLPARFIMRSTRAIPLSRLEAPRLYAAVTELSRRAGLEKTPDLYFQPGKTLNAFAAGGPKDPAISISGLLAKILTTDELTAIIGHEITHIKNNDMQVMAMANLFSRVTHYLSITGQVLLIVALPFILLGGSPVPVALLALLIFAPGLSVLLNLALSRTREFAADMGSAELTGNPYALIRALEKIERIHSRTPRPTIVPGYYTRIPEWLRTHPPTSERTRRLGDLPVTPRVIPVGLRPWIQYH